MNQKCSDLIGRCSINYSLKSKHRLFLVGSTLSYSLAPKKTLNLIDYKSSNDKNKAELNPQSNKRSKDITTKESSLTTHQFKNKSR